MIHVNLLPAANVLSTAISDDPVTPVAGAFTASSSPVSGMSQVGGYDDANLLDLHAMSEEDLTQRLLQRASVWNFRRLGEMGRKLAGADDAEKGIFFTAMGDVFASASYGRRNTADIERTFRKLGFDDEMLAFARDYLKDRVRTIASRLTERGLNDQKQLVREFLEFALHSREEVPICLFLAKRTALALGMDWKALVRHHRESRSEYEKGLIDFVDDRGGVVPFDAYFLHAMFNSRTGTYTAETAKHLISHDIDMAPQSFFRTASADPNFARTFAAFAKETWVALGRPEVFDVVEMGAGNGRLAEGILDFADSGLKPALRYRIVEKSPALAEIQRNRLERFGDKAQVICASAISGRLPKIQTGLFISNELVDMFPPRKVINRSGRLFEGYVAHRGGMLQEIAGPLRRDTEDFLVRRGIVLSPGETFYIQPDIDPWLARVYRHLGSGYVVTVDYGHRREGLRRTRSDFVNPIFRGYLAWNSLKRRMGLLSFASYSNNPVGVSEPKDMTVDVDFTTLEEAARSLGGASRLISQRDFMRRYAQVSPKEGEFGHCFVSLLAKNAPGESV